MTVQRFNTVGWAAEKASGLQKNLSDVVLVWLSVCIEVKTICAKGILLVEKSKVQQMYSFEYLFLLLAYSQHENWLTNRER